MADAGSNPPDAPNTGPKELREAHEREKARADAAEARLRDMAFKAAGLDPTKGIGKAVAQTYTGDVDDVDSILTHAKTEYEWEPKAAEPPAPVNEPSEAQRYGENIAERQSRMAETSGQGIPQGNPGDDLDRQIEAAMSEGRYTDSLNLKAQKLYGIMNR